MQKTGTKKRILFDLVNIIIVREQSIKNILHPVNTILESFCKKISGKKELVKK